MTPYVSVIMPVYNVESYVAEAINSVLAQTFRNFELIIVNDGSTDNSLSICESFDDSRIQIINQPNRGLAGARNSGILHARGEYVALLDSDDRWLPEKLELHVIHMDNNPDVGVSFCPSRFIDMDGQPLNILQKPKLGAVDPADIFCRNPVGNGSAPVIRRSELENVAAPHPREFTRTCYFDESLRQSEDIELWLRMAVIGGTTFAGIEPVLTEYRVASGGLSAQIVRQYQSWQMVVDRLESLAPEFVEKHVDRARAYQLRYLARRSVQLGDPNMAVTLLREAFQSSKRPLWEEPKKSLITLAAAWVGRILPAEVFAKLVSRSSGGKLIA